MKLHVLAFLVYAIQVSLGFPQKQIETPNDIKIIQIETKKAADELEKFASDAAKSIKGLFDHDEISVVEKIESLKDDTWKKIKSKMTAFENEEKKAEACYKTASENLDEIFVNGKKDVRMCQFDAFFYGFTPVYMNANFTKEMGDNLFQNFDNIIKRCETFDGQQCLTRNNPVAKLLFENLKITMTQMKKLIQQTVAELTDKASKCFSDKSDSLNAKSQEVEEEAIKCIYDL